MVLLEQPTVIRHNAFIVGAFGHIIADDDAVLVAAIVLTMFKPFFDCRLHLRSSTRCPHTNDQQSVFCCCCCCCYPSSKEAKMFCHSSRKYDQTETSGWLRLAGTTLPEPGHRLGLKCLILNNHVSSFFCFLE